MLVLTTMFINVSNNLPKTAYIKMIDIWLLFNLIKPFNDILVTTYVDTLKDDDAREINHHGAPRNVGEEAKNGLNVVQVAPVSRKDLVSINERQQQKSLKVFYEKQKQQKNKNRIKRLKRFSLVINPMICVGFVLLYWVVGLNHYYTAV